MMIRNLITMLTLLLIFTSVSQGQDRGYYESVRQNIFTGRIVGIYLFYMNEPILIEEDSTNESLKIFKKISGDVLSSSSDKGSLELYLKVRNNDGVYIFKILNLKRHQKLSKKRKSLYRKDYPDLKQLAIGLKVGDEIKIPSSSPLSLFSRVFAGFIYKESEKIKKLYDANTY